MKPFHALMCIILISTLMPLMSACSPPSATQTPPAGSLPASSVPAVYSAQVALSAPSPTSIPTEKPTKTPSPSAAVSASDENGKVVIADGFYYYKLNDEIKKRITGMSFPSDIEDSKITYGDLRYIRLKYYDFSGGVHDDGELIVNAKLAEEVTQIFYELYKAKYPFTSIRLVDDYGEPGDDNLSMAANNTSAFNYRYVTGTKTLSLHSYGDAIDINPKINPYITNGRVSPANGAQYADRSLHLPGMIDKSDLCFKLFTADGWKWGGNASEDKDYQHFSKNVGV